MRISFGLLVSAVSISLSANSQITIQSNHLPDAGDVLLQVPHTLLGNFDPEDVGADYTWTLTEEDLMNLGGGTPLNCIDVASTPFTYQFLFNNPFDPEHNADFAFGVDAFDVVGYLSNLAMAIPATASSTSKYPLLPRTGLLKIA
jgi:hypothetical protein